MDGPFSMLFVLRQDGQQQFQTCQCFFFHFFSCTGFSAKRKTDVKQRKKLNNNFEIQIYLFKNYFTDFCEIYWMSHTPYECELSCKKRNCHGVSHTGKKNPYGNALNCIFNSIHHLYPKKHKCLKTNIVLKTISMFYARRFFFFKNYTNYLESVTTFVVLNLRTFLSQHPAFYYY